MKPILYNTEMVRAIQNGTKTATRRVVKPQPPATAHVVKTRYSWGWSWWEDSDSHEMKPPYNPGAILYVRETWGDYSECQPGGAGYYLYRADYPDGAKTDTSWDGVIYDLPRWRPSIHMPREAARIFLRVTDVRAQCVQDITEEKARKEGCKDREDFHRVWDYCYSEPLPVKAKGIIHHYESYPWEDIQETRTCRGKPWYVIGNPWVWVIEFERCERQEGDGHGD